VPAGRTSPLSSPELTAAPTERESSGPGTFDRFETAFTQAAHGHGGARTTTLAVAGDPVQLSFSSPELESLFLPALSHLVVPPSAGRAVGSQARPALRLLVWDSASSGVDLPYRSRPKQATAAISAREATGTCSLYHESGPGEVWGLSLYEPARHGGGLWVSDASRVPWWERAAPLRVVWQWALTRPDRCLAHAAAVGGPAGGILLVGKGGSGKSTTTVAAALGGMAVAGDDYVVLEDRPGAGVVACSLYATTKLVPGTARLLPGTATLLAGPSGTDGEKLVVGIEQIRAGALCAELTVRAVVIPQISAGPGGLSKASMADAFRALAPSTVFQHFVRGAASFSPLARMLRQLPCYRLALGPDPQEAVGLLKGLLAQGGI
jgi:hypothetical protein